MNTRDVRVGNIIQCALNESLRIPDGIPRKVFEVNMFGDITVDVFAISTNIIKVPEVHCSGIKLGKEWLLKCRFRYVEKWKIFELHANGFAICFSETQGLWIEKGFENESQEIDLKHIQYVHQLQNLYLSLTGEELDIINP